MKHKGTDLSLPPVYTLITLREAGDPFATAIKNAGQGAGTLVWGKRYHSAEFAVVLEPEQPFETAVLVLCACMNALYEALSSHANPEKPVAIGWPDALLVDGAIAGGGRLAWPEKANPGEIPAWLVFGATMRISTADPNVGTWTRGTTLQEENFGDVSASALVDTASRYLLSAIYDFGDRGPRHQLERYRHRLAQPVPATVVMDKLLHVLRSPSWLDPQTGEPWR